MRKINRTDVLKLVLVLAFVAAIGTSVGAIGRFTPTHAIVEPVFCGSCHPDQIRELNATTHLPHFAGAIIEEAEAIEAGGTGVVTQAEAVSGACMMCHNTWANRDKIVVNGYNLLSDIDTGFGVQTKLTFNGNGVGFNPRQSGGTSNAKTATAYDVAVTSTTQKIRLGSSVSAITATVQDPGSSGLAAGTKLNATVDYNLNGSVGIDLLNSTNVSVLNGTGALKIVYTVSGEAKTYKEVWGALSALSPQPGAFWDDSAKASTDTASCGNPEKGLCHIVEVAVGKSTKNQMQENNLGSGGSSSGSGNGIYFQHEMAYTSAEYAAKQVKLCGVCHVNKLPPMTPEGEPIRQEIGAEAVYRYSHSAVLINTTNDTIISPDWAHRQVQCIRCHSHAGIGGEYAGVQSTIGTP